MGGLLGIAGGGVEGLNPLNSGRPDGTIVCMNQTMYRSAAEGEIRRFFPELVRYRYLLWDFVWRELRARYRNAMMGFAWAFLQPILMMATLTLVFGYLLPMAAPIRLSQSSHPYAVFVLCGLVPWHFFTMALTRGTNSLNEHEALIKKVWFPREVVPIAAVTVYVTNVIIGFGVLLVVMVLLEGFGSIGAGIIYVPFLFAIQFALVLGLALILSTFNVYYHDVGYILEAGLTLAFYATPIIYSYELPYRFPGWLFRIYMLNPMAPLTVAYQQAILDNRLPDLGLVAESVVMTAAAVSLGLWVFRRHAPTFADHL